MARPAPSVGRSEVGPSSKWVTRARIRVNRTATAWLIRRFIDPAAIFLFVEPDEVVAVQQREDATGFDAPGATYPHRDAEGRCSFEALVDLYRPDDAALQEIACIVHGADFEEEMRLVPESAGLGAIVGGFPLVARDDDAILVGVGFILDSVRGSLSVG